MQRKLERSQQYQVLQAMGFSPWLSKAETPLLSIQPVFNASCLVILPEKLQSSDQEANKILNGMLKVLEIDLEKIAVSWVKEVDFSKDQQNLQQEIVKWSPKTVLMMGEEAAQAVLSNYAAIDTLREEPHWIPDSKIFLQVTFDPIFLKEFPEHKKKAYQDLLRLRDHLRREKVT